MGTMCAPLPWRMMTQERHRLHSHAAGAWERYNIVMGFAALSTLHALL